MPTQIATFWVTKLMTETSFSYLSQVAGELAKLTDTALKTKAKPFQDSVVAFDDALKPASLKPFTKKVDEARALCDKTFSGFNEAQRAGLKHFDPEIAAATYKISEIIATYGNPNPKADMEKLWTLKNIIQDLKSPKYLPAAQKSGLDVRTPKLEEATIAFDQALLARSAERGDQTKGATATARKNAETEYHAIIQLVNATLLLDSTPELEKFANTMNAMIDERRTSLNISASARKPAEEEKENAE